MLHTPLPDFGGLTKANLQQMVPHAFRETPSNPRLSGNYVHVPTYEVIDDLEKLGWYPMQASQRKHRKADSIFTSHMVKFRNPDLKILGQEKDDSYPEIILLNSHDGLSSFKFMIGLYRLVCSNGLIIATEQFADFKIKHMGYTFEELRATVEGTVQELPNKLQILNEMKNTDLTQTQQEEFAIKGYLLRRGIVPAIEETLQDIVDQGTVQAILQPQRESDKGSDLWVTYNKVQEAVINGGFHGALAGARVRKVKKITNFHKDIQLNRQLFQLATEYLPA